MVSWQACITIANGLSIGEKEGVQFTNLEEEIDYYIKLPLRQLADVDETDIPWKSERVARRWQVAREEYGNREASDATFEGSKDEGDDDSAESGDESDGDPNSTCQQCVAVLFPKVP
jgi:hypothetical protein